MANHTNSNHPRRIPLDQIAELRERYLPEASQQDLEQLAEVVAALARSPKQLSVLLTLTWGLVRYRQREEARGSAELV